MTTPDPAPAPLRPPAPIRVVEMTTGIAGAYCGKLLADAGAEVTLVEPEGGHPLRRRRPVPEARPGALFEFLAEDKGLHAGEPSEAVAGAHVLLLDGAPPDGWPAVPLTVSISPFGLDGPWAGRPATEFTLQALCGSTGKRGLPGRPPVHSGGAPVEFVAGSYAAAAVSCFLWDLDPGTPRHLDVSRLEAGSVTMHAFMTIDAAFRGERVRPSRKTLIPSIEPTADGYVGFSTITAQQFTDFMHMIDRPDLAADQSLLIPEERHRRRDEVVGAIRAWTSVRSTAEIVEQATAFRIPVAPIGNGANLPTNEHLAERGAFRPTRGGLVAPRRPYLLSEGQADPRPGRWSGGGGGSRPLDGLRVADFTAFWAGPSATHVLAALGADVVKVESEARPDGMRYTSSRPGADDWLEYSPVFFGVNANKRSVSLDLRDPHDREKAERLIAWADVVTENFSPRVMDEFGLGFERVNQINPSAVLVRMPAFGLTGPWRDRTGFAMTVEQASGLAWQTGYADGPPMDVGGVCDPLCGMHAVVALMAALRRRAATGRGMLVEVPLVEVALNVAAEQILQYSWDGVLIGRDSNRGPDGAPQGVYPAAGEDRWIALSVRDDRDWDELRALLGHPAWSRAGDLASRDGRFAAEARIDERIAEWSASRDAGASVASLLERGIPAAVVMTPPEVADLEQLRSRRFFETVVHPVVGEREIPSLPFRLVGAEPGWYRTPPPTVGQHSAEVEAGILAAGVHPA